MGERMEVSMVILDLSFTFFVWFCRRRSTVLYGCSSFGFSLLRESLVTGQSHNLLLRPRRSILLRNFIGGSMHKRMCN